MNTTTTILRAEILRLEKQAVTLEKMVYRELVELEWLPGDNHTEDSSILQKLRKLDEIQEEIDGHVATLKERGDYTPVRLAQRYREQAEAPAITRERKEVDPRATERWLAANEFMQNGNGLINNNDIRNLFGLSQPAACQMIKGWLKAGMITMSGLQGGSKKYCRIEDTHLHEIEQIYAALSNGPLCQVQVELALGYKAHPVHMLRVLGEAVEAGKFNVREVNRRKVYSIAC